MKKLVVLILASALLTACEMPVAPPAPVTSQEQNIDNQVNAIVKQAALKYHARPVDLVSIINPKYYLYLYIDETAMPIVMPSNDVIDLKDAFNQGWPVYEFDYSTDRAAALAEIKQRLAQNPTEFKRVVVK